VAKFGSKCMLEVKASTPQVPHGRMKLLQMSLAHLLLSRRAPANSAKMRQVTMDITQRLQDKLLPLKLCLCCPSFFRSCFWASCPLLRDSRALRPTSPQNPLAMLATAERAWQRPTSAVCLYCSSNATAGKQYCAPVPLSDIRRSMSESWN